MKMIYIELIFKFTSCELLFVSEACFDIDDISVFIGEDGGVFIFLGEPNDAFTLFGDGDLSLWDLFNIFFTFDFVFVGLIASVLPCGLVRIISRRSSSNICLMPKLLA